MAALVAAAAGVRVVKHGGRSVSSKSGSADVLEALGIPLGLDPAQVARCVTEIGIGFTFAPNYHHGLRHAAPVRRALGVPTAINYLAPLTNPARPATALIGCSSLAVAPVLAAVLADRGATALVVRGHDGLDEITTADATDLWTATPEGVRKNVFDTARFGLRRARPGDLAGGDAAYNAKVVRSVAEGEPGATLDAVLVNAAGALAAGNGAAGAGDFEDAFASGLDQARTAVSSGAAARLLDQWISLAVELADPADQRQRRFPASGSSA
jgi:anthranilate phosphoribosyltransferase